MNKGFGTSISLWSDCRNDDNNFGKNFTRLCVETLILETIGCNGKLLGFQLTGSLGIFSVL